jgi:cyclophilin family peptidyl-prolyl cis-trans isomerase
MSLRKYLGPAIVAMLAITLVACGSESAEPEVPAPTDTTSSADTNSERSCWSDEDRSSEGSSEVPNQQQWSSAPEMQIDPEKAYVATMNTSEGTFKIELLPKEAPKTVNNFVCLARAGYFDNTPFHRILAGFVIQGGDPTGTGSGGPGYRFEDEPVNLDYEKGTVAMANAGPNTNGSQFFVVLDDLQGRLQKNYTIFGKVSEGMDVVEQLGQVQTTTNARGGEKSVPVEPVTLDSVTVEETSS